MKYVAKDWNNNQKQLKILLSKEETFDHGKIVLMEMHNLLHDKKIYKDNIETYYDFLWTDLLENTCKIISKEETSILWNIWHITRIEDLIANIIIGNKEEIFNNEIKKQLNINIKDTGNAMNHDEMEKFNNSIIIEELKKYRIKVGKSTKEIIKDLKYKDIKRKTEKKQLEIIRKNGGIIDHEKSRWLLDFWGNKDVLGLIMMPITRHQIVHLNNCIKIKEKYNKK